MSTAYPEELARLLKTQKYHLIGMHSAVKTCRWLYQSLVHDRPCYKQQFYGIRSHRCLQMTPTVAQCNQKCRFCWRIQSGDKKIRWNEMAPNEWDDPESIVEACLETQRKLVSGYKGNPNVTINAFREASEPKHVAISLAGEPTLYPHLSELIQCFNKRNMTTFLVSNGTNPDALTQLSQEPTQLYISLCASNEETHKRTCRPQIPNAWKKLCETLSLLSSFKCPTVLRITLTKELNMRNPEQYARLIAKANPTYVEPKAYMHVGFSRLRLSYSSMPLHEEIRLFATRLADQTGYKILREAPESRVVLLSQLNKPITVC